MRLDSCPNNNLRGGLFRQRGKDGSKNWPKFEGTYEGKEQGIFSPRKKQVQASSESSPSSSSASFWPRVKAQQFFVVEEWVKSARSEARATFDAWSEVEVELGALKENHSKMAEQLKEAVRARDSAEADLKTTEK